MKENYTIFTNPLCKLSVHDATWTQSKWMKAKVISQR